MASMIERVNACEQEAAAILRTASENAREKVAEAAREAEKTVAAAKEAAKETTRLRAEAAGEESEKRRQAIREAGTEAACAQQAQARARIDDAAAFILSEVTK